MPDRCFIDSNITMYAHGGAHQLKDPCLRVLSRMASGEIEGVTSVEIIQEIVYRYASLRRRQAAKQIADHLVTLVAVLLPVTAVDIDLFLAYLLTYDTAATRDLLHAAVMVNNGIETIISADTDFDALPMIKRLDPRRIAEK